MARNRKRAKDRRSRRPQPVAAASAEREQARSPLSADQREEALRPIAQDGHDEALADAGADPRDVVDADADQALNIDTGDSDLATQAGGRDALDLGDDAPGAPADAGADDGHLAGDHEPDADDELELPAAIAHAAPDVELAEAQLAVGRPQSAHGAEPDVDEDELEREAVDAAGPAGSSRGGRGGAVAVATAVAPERRPGPGRRVITFLQGSWRELQRVQWPDRRQVMQATGVVIGFVIVAGAFLGAADWLATKIVNYILS